MGASTRKRQERRRRQQRRRRRTGWRGFVDDVFDRDLATDLLASAVGAFALSWFGDGGLVAGAALGAILKRIVVRVVRRWRTRSIWAGTGVFGVADGLRALRTLLAHPAAALPAASAAATVATAVTAVGVVGTVATGNHVAQPVAAITASSSAPWDQSASAFRGRNGLHVRYRCPPGGSGSTLWGTDVYTDDSDVCVAAVHAGLIGFERGGTVTIEIRRDAGSYRSTTRHGVTSGSYGYWYGAYTFVRGTDQQR